MRVAVLLVFASLGAAGFVHAGTRLDSLGDRGQDAWLKTAQGERWYTCRIQPIGVDLDQACSADEMTTLNKGRMAAASQSSIADLFI